MFLIELFFYRENKRNKEEKRLARDANLKIHMCSVRYVHTKRFIQEIQDFFQEFSLLQAVSSHYILHLFFILCMRISYRAIIKI